MPRVDVIIPNYNHALFLEKRIRSVLDQTFQDLDVILLDDASTDNSREVIAQFANDPRVRVILNDTNSGNVFKQWNKGLKEARGDYVWIAESDDVADTRFLEELVGRLESHPKAGLAYCQTCLIDEADNRLGIVESNRPGLDPDHWKSDYFNDGRRELSDHLVLSCTIINASSVIMRRAVAERLGLVDENWRVAGDYYFWARMLGESDIAFVAQPLNFLRTHVGSVSDGARKSGVVVEETYRVVSYIADHVSIAPEALERARALRFNSWICYNEDSPFPVARHKAIYAIARRFDPHINRRILTYLPLFPLRYVGRRIKRLVSQRLHRTTIQGATP